ncbi:hypothetical protein CVT25_006586 [Psilocybe cyanescens]|uniref:Uncharacterized protein n=1 Tax=Psilocybe cyanescens TaxID=93625 RepID=A0A409X425_PSICY|nr:hypothetical protein CVT25_006586 [Psilocybe cyanescens]
MSSRSHAHSPTVRSPLNNQHISPNSSDHGVRLPVTSNNWLNVDPYLSPQSVRPPSMQSSRSSSAGSAAQFYAYQTSLYVPSPPSTNVRPYASSPYHDVRRPPSPHRESGIRYKSERGQEGVVHHFRPPPTVIVTPEHRRAPTGVQLTDVNLEAHTRKTQSSYKSLQYSPSVATSLSVYSQESAPRSYHSPPFINDFIDDISDIDNSPRAYVQLGRDSYSTENTADMSTSATNDSTSNYQSSLASRTTARTTPQQSTWHMSIPNIPTIPQNTKEPKAVRYAMNDEVYSLGPEFITYIPAGPNAASTTNVSYTGIRNQVVKRGNDKHKNSPSTSVSIQPVNSSSASVKSLPMAYGKNDHLLLKKKRHGNIKKSFRDGETQSLYSAKSATTMSAGKRILSFFRFRRFLPGGKRKNFKNNLSSLDLDGYEVNRYFSKA